MYLQEATLNLELHLDWKWMEEMFRISEGEAGVAISLRLK